MEKILITGASSGIGRELAKILAKDMKKIFLLARSIEKLKELKEELENIYPNLECESLKFDLSDIEYMDNIVEKCDVDTVINCAGFGRLDKFLNISLDEEIKTINVNYVAPIILTRKYIDKFLKEDKGLIVNICSTAALYYHPYMNIYSSTKAGLLHYSLGIDEELKSMKSNVRVLSICPGPTETNFFNKNIQKKFGSSQKLMMSAQDVAKEIIKSIDKKKTFSIIGFRNKISMFLLDILPISMQLKLLSIILGKVLK